MPALREVQAAFRAAILGDEPAGARDGAPASLRGDAAASGVEGVLDDGLTAAARLRIYRHHVFTSLTAALQATFPVVHRLVGDGFFRYAADAYIRRHPPSTPVLSEYGGSLPSFLAEFPPCRALAYLPDVARLEWAMSEAFHAADVPPLAPGALQAIAPENLADGRFTLDPSLSLLVSRWPVDMIWKANQGDEDSGTAVDLASRGARLAVRRIGDDVVFHALDAGRWALWQALGDRRTLGAAVDAALAAEPGFDLASAIADLLAGGLLVGIELTNEGRANDGTDDGDHER